MTDQAVKRLIKVHKSHVVDTVRSEELPDKQWPNLGASQFSRTNGIRWHYQRMGSGPRLLLIHGTGASTHSWRELLPALAPYFEIVAPDLPGHGYSLRVESHPMTPAHISDSLVQLNQQIGFSPQVVVGHSAGAAVAVALYLRQRDTIKAIVGLNPALQPYGGVFRVLFEPLAKAFAAFPLTAKIASLRAKSREGIRELIDSTGSKIDERGLTLYQSLFTKKDHVQATLDMMAQWDLDEVSSALSQLDVPCHIVVGDNDKSVPPIQSQRVSKIIPNCTLTIQRGLGHLAHEEAPTETAEIIRRVLSPTLSEVGRA